MIKSRRNFMTTAAAAVAAPFVASLPGKALETPKQNGTDLAEGPQFIPAALTMLDKKRRFDDAMNRDYLAYLSENGADGVLVLGTTGEFPSFSIAERKSVLESFVKHKGKLSITSHVGTPNLPETLELLEHATTVGASAALVVPPFYFKEPTVEGLEAYFEPILETARIPVLVYNIPQLSGVTITVELMKRLSRHGRLYGMKDSFNDTDAHLEFIHELPKLRFLTGRTSVLASSLPAGGAGTISGSGSLLTRETRAVFDTFRSGGDLSAAQDKLNQGGRALRGFWGIPALKYLLSRLGLPESFPRPPLEELSAEQKKKAAEAWETYQSERA